MSYVIYHIETTRFLHPGSYATRGAAKAALTREAKKTPSLNKADYSIEERTMFHELIEKKTIRKGIVGAAGKEFEVPVNTEWTSGPWSETYWCS